MADKYQILNELKSLLALKLGDNLKEVILFGSQAYGGAHEYSDFDFLVILKEIPDWTLKRKISEYCYEIDLKYEVFTDVHILGEDELNTLRGKQPIFQTAIQKGIYA
ncbi:MAG TPA: nucleotidyltransferase domain-containing protein [Mariniphaga anaerophila]|uniref:Nucleotidyltransferase domain-containing protein n=1 Tax=Mariniphaga anaerophila TaxID=1484053 RepID=A0A831PP56_9BACT|nr:nucleotidyltransferase domain-containing protein [Mariniphaga anaerophila]